MQTVDGVEITEHLRIWVDNHHPATVDIHLTHTHARPGQLVVRLDSGHAVQLPPTAAAVRHGLSWAEPPALGLCQWVRSCGRLAVRMQLMSPVPVCPACITEYRLR